MRHIVIVFQSTLDHSIQYPETIQQLQAKHANASTSNFALVFPLDGTTRRIVFLVSRWENHNSLRGV